MDYSLVRESLRDTGINSLSDLFSTYTGDASGLKSWVRGAPINRDGNLRLSYLAGWGINSDLADDLYQKMLTYRRPTADIYVGPPDDMQKPLAALGGAGTSRTAE